MDVSSDYEDDSSQYDGNNALPKPFFVRPPKRPQRIGKPHGKRAKENSAPKPSVKRSCTPLIFRQHVPPTGKKHSARQNNTSAPVKPPSSVNSGPLYEFGHPVNGYKFIAPLERVRTWQRRAIQELPPPLAVPHYLQEYWSEQSRAKCFPVDPGDNITKEAVRAFYQRSCKLLDMDMKTLLKSERIRWHPDKSSLREATQLFQIINELWESLQSV